MEKRWRFPACHFGIRKGISSGDAETFRRSPYQAFAREVLQNSIDARLLDEEPTMVEFSSFVMNTEDIPNVSDLKAAIERCKEYWKDKEEYVNECNEMLEVLSQKEIKCLRVSDYNTTGLIGIDSNDMKDNKFLALTKGTGVSEKTGSQAGGSKGVGKNAAFLMSSLKTVFYSTIVARDIYGNEKKSAGSIGVADLISGYVEKEAIPEESRDYTQGTGYYSIDDKNGALKEQINLDSNSNRKNGETGTDIFIVGFMDNIGDDDWEKEIINSILDSFMYAIVRRELIVTINNITIDRENLANLVNDENIIYPHQKANITSLYQLSIGGENVKTYPINTDYGECVLYMMHDEKNKELMTKKCAMVRYPLMKICEIKLGMMYDVSAMCIISKGKLGEELRKIENPQHIAWETKRIKDRNKRKEISNVIKNIEDQIIEAARDCVRAGEKDVLDPEGAGDVLPDVDAGTKQQENKDIKMEGEKISVSKPKVVKTLDKKSYENMGNNGISPDIGGINEENDGEVLFPQGHNKGDKGPIHPGSETGEGKEGDQIILKRNKELSGVHYKIICLSKINGKYRISFVSPNIDIKNCYLRLFLRGEADYVEPIKVMTLSINNVSIECNDESENLYGPFSFNGNKNIKIDITVDKTDYFGSEVKLICK